MKNAANHFLGNVHINRNNVHLVKGEDHEQIKFGQLSTNDFFHLCHALELIDPTHRTGATYERLVMFWEDILKNIPQYVDEYAERRPGLRLPPATTRYSR